MKYIIIIIKRENAGFLAGIFSFLYWIGRSLFLKRTSKMGCI